jgi:hypothetical protein
MEKNNVKEPGTPTGQIGESGSLPVNAVNKPTSSVPMPQEGTHAEAGHLLANKLTASSKKATKEGSPSTMVLVVLKLRATIKAQNDVINKLCTEANILSQVVTLTRSDKVKDGIANIVSTVDELSKNRKPLHCALNDALQLAQQSSQAENQPPATDSIPQSSQSGSKHHAEPDNKHQEIQERLDRQDTKLEAIMACLANLQQENSRHEAHGGTKAPRPQLNTKTNTRRQEAAPTPTTASDLKIPTEYTWTEIVQRNNPQNNRKTKKRHRPEAVVVQAEGLTYTDMLRRIKTDKEVQAVSTHISAISMTRAGHLRVVLNKETENGETISKTLQKAIGECAKTVTLKESTRVQISDVDEEASDNEILGAIADKTGSIDTVNIVSKRKVGRGVQLVYVSVPSAVVHKVTPRIRKGYTNCRTKPMIEVKKCFKCQSFGHTRSNCTEAEIEDRCWKCGEAGHKSHACEKKPKCLLCAKETSDDHIMGIDVTPTSGRSKLPRGNDYKTYKMYTDKPELL